MARVRMGMVGGGEGAFIGAVHRMAAALDGDIELVCGAFSADAERSQRSGATLNLQPDRVYNDYTTMMQVESARPADERMQFVAIVTPNHLHFPVAQAALTSGFHVLSDKPATLDLAEALILRDVVRESGLLYGLTHTYTGYPLVKEARERIASGALGSVRKVVVDYTQGWLSQPEEAGNKQARWRLDPKQSGASCCMGDIGVHAANLAEYISGLRVTQLCSDLGAVVPGRVLDDDGAVLLRFDNGARGVLQASQVSAGEENNLTIRVYGDSGGLSWSQQEPNTLWLKWPNRPDEMLRTGGPYLTEAASSNTRLPMGHPEGYLEAFANLYRAFARDVRAREEGVATMADYPGIEDGVRGMQFIERAVETSASGNKWHPFDAS